ncbi:MAG: hypothetical protein QM532_03935 [Cyanobium sp. MAG06]|nr:hypothetical protein [Cyanobium sp. MAG06]
MKQKISNISDKAKKGVNSKVQDIANRLRIDTSVYERDEYGNIVVPESKDRGIIGRYNDKNQEGFGVKFELLDLYKYVKLSEYVRETEKQKVNGEYVNNTIMAVNIGGKISTTTVTSEMIKQIRSYKDQRSKIFARQFNNTVDKYLELYSLYDEVIKTYIISPSVLIAEKNELQNLYNQITKKELINELATPKSGNGIKSIKDILDN